MDQCTFLRSVAVCSLLICPVAARAIAVSPSRDSALYESADGSLADGSGRGLFVGQKTSGAFARRALRAFDCNGQILTRSAIHSVDLTLHVSRTTSGPWRVSLHRVLVDWGEGGSVADGNRGGRSGCNRTTFS